MSDIHLWGVKQNNLKDIEVKVPIGSLTVVCGPSGSGKSSLAFQTLFAEGQRRFIESMSNYARQFLNKAPKPDIEGIANIPPAIAIEQKNSVKTSRSTVGTVTELVDYLRLLFEKIGQPYCPTHHIPTEKMSVTEATDRALKTFSGKRGYLLVEIPEIGRIAEGKKLHALLLQEGFLRIYLPPEEEGRAAAKGKAKKTTAKATAKKDLPLDRTSTNGTSKSTLGEVLDIGDAAALKKGLPQSTFYVVVDRLSFQKEDRSRLADSIGQAYEASLKFSQNVNGRRTTIITTEGERLDLSEEASCPLCHYTPPPLTSRLFSFNSPLGACPTCKGFGNILTLDEAKVVPNPNLSLAQGALHPFTMPSAASDKKTLLSFCKKEKIDLHTPWMMLPADAKKKIWDGTDDFFGVKGLFEYLEEIKYKMHVRVFISRYRSPFLCPDCKGSRLRSEANHVFVKGYNVQALCEMTVTNLRDVFERLTFSKKEEETCAEVLKQLRSRLDFLIRVGVHYLTLNREAKTLSGGEYQRLILANQLGMGLSQTLYVLDEPTVGLHPRDNDRLISILKDLKNLGNTLVVVEHDHDVINSCDHIIEMGPGSGYLGGEVVYAGSMKGFFSAKKSNTAKYLRPYEGFDASKPARPVDSSNYKYKITLSGARGHNLKNVDVTFPLNRLISVTGVSGSGKTTLITKTLYPALARELNVEFMPSQPYQDLSGFDHVKNVTLIDQTPIGKTARSNPATYLKIFDGIRTVMASLPESKSASYTPGTFSLNVDGGRCPACKGTGFEEIDMMFMDNVILTCDVCDGKKYRPEILEIKYNRKSIHDILNMTVAEAMDFFVAYPGIRKSLAILSEVGLEYIRLGQSASSLSGGESQRLKIAKELSQVSQKSTLYILDEPTTGLHFREIDLLMKVLHKLIDAGGSVIVVEHNLDVIRQSDYVIDLGPDAGANGGEIVATGSPSDIMKSEKSLTGKYLRKYQLDHSL